MMKPYTKDLLFLGDSITDCYHSFDPDNLGDGYVRIIAEQLDDKFGIIKVTNMGYDGFTLSALKRLWNRITAPNTDGAPYASGIRHSNEITNFKPEFITILIGINDIGVIKNTGADPEFALKEFQIGYQTLIEQIKETTDCPILLMEPFIFPYPAEYAAWESDLHKMNNIIENIAENYHIAYLPLWEKLKEAANKYGYNGITIDGIHLTREGHRILADSWLNYYRNHA